MRYNGLQLLIELAVRAFPHPWLLAHQDLLVHGAIREDVVAIPWGRRIVEHASLTHFTGTWAPGGFFPLVTPSAAWRADRLVARAAVRAAHEDPLGAAVALGRASHLVIDMACPVHARRVPHLTDGYEWFLEAHATELARLDATPFDENGWTVRAIVHDLVRFTRRFEPDRTGHHLGRLLHRLGLRRPPTRARLEAQARAIVPEAAGRLAAIYRLFAAQAGV